MTLLSNWIMDSFNPLFRAIEKGDLALFEKYANKWKAKKDIGNLRNSKGETPLIAIAREMFSKRPSPELVGMFTELLKVGSSPNTQDYQGYSALSYLIGYIPNDKSKEYASSTRFFGVRAEEFNFGEYRRFGKGFADEYVELGDGRVRFIPYLLDLLIEGPERVDFLDWSTPLFDTGDGAVYPRLQNQEVAEIRAWALAKSKQWGEVFAQAMDFTKPTLFDQETLLFEASRQGNLSAIQTLLDKGVDIQQVNRVGRTVYDEAHSNTKVEVHSLLDQIELQKQIPQATSNLSSPKTARL